MIPTGLVTLSPITDTDTRATTLQHSTPRCRAPKATLLYPPLPRRRAPKATQTLPMPRPPTLLYAPLPDAAPQSYPTLLYTLLPAPPDAAHSTPRRRAP
jgi:hypothetical protein